MEQLLSTKLYIPPTRLKLVSRPRLVERINEGLHRKLTLISAPAGFGKTTLVSEWVEQSRSDDQNEFSIAWLSLDENDNDLVRFLSYFIAAFKRVEKMSNAFGGGALSMLQTPQPLPTEAILTALINDISALSSKIIMVLDDYHLISQPAIDDTLTFLLDHLPLQLHLIISTRVDPQLALARLRARGQLNELRAEDLRFSATEAAKFLNETMGLALSEENITSLESRTEGWIVGLQLAAISMQGSEDTTSFINSFTGSHRLVLDYLIEEVLEQQPPDIQNFLLQTSILDQISGSLCDALTGEENGQEILEILEQNNLFITPMDDERRWYRYHHLFADLLRRQLHSTNPELIPTLHSRAEIWFEKHGYIPQAIRHAFASHDLTTATRLIEKGSINQFERSQFRFILNWVDKLTETQLKSSPLLFIYHTWVLVLIGQIETVKSRTENIDWLFNAVNNYDDIQKKEIFGFVAGLKAVLCLWYRDYANALDCANQALANLPENNWVAGYCAMVEGLSSWAQGNLTAARNAYAKSFTLGKVSKNIMLSVSAKCLLAHAVEHQGHLQEAYQLFQDSFQLAEQDGKLLPVAAYSHIEFARVLHEMNDLVSANRHLQEGINLCRLMGDRRAETIAHGLLGRVQLAQGEYSKVLKSIEDAAGAHPSPDNPFDLRGGEYLDVRLWLSQKKNDELVTWIKNSGLNIDAESHFKIRLTYTMHARVLIALCQEHPESTYLRDAHNLLNKLSELAESNGWGRRAIEILTLQALACEREGDTVGAMTALEKALTLAEPEGFIRTFVDEGPPMAKLLYKALDRGISPEYVSRLLRAFPDQEPEQTTPAKTKGPNANLIEPLSERECEVLQLIGDGLTNKEIADRLFLSLNTVKVHIRNIFGKLGVNNRMQAVTKAKILRVLPSD